jgi:hypothetical protein
MTIKTAKQLHVLALGFLVLQSELAYCKTPKEFENIVKTSELPENLPRTLDSKDEAVSQLAQHLLEKLPALTISEAKKARLKRELKRLSKRDSKPLSQKEQQELLELRALIENRIFNGRPEQAQSSSSDGCENPPIEAGKQVERTLADLKPIASNLASTGSKDEGVVLILNSDPNDPYKRPRKFRKSDGPIVSKDKPVNRTGLDDLNISGSSEFSEKELEYLKKNELAGKKVTVVDLRQESHALVNGRAVTWYKKYSSINRGKSLEEIESDEAKRVEELRSQKVVEPNHIQDRADDPDPLLWKTEKKSMTPKYVMRERELAKKLGYDYFRIIAPDYQKPGDADVDRFVEFAKTLPKDQWLHFHCAGGGGRTTTFMAMYDMIRNHDKKVTDQEILYRQRAIGGFDLAAESERTDENRRNWAKERTIFINKFYRYCKDQGSSGFKIPWSEWSKTH